MAEIVRMDRIWQYLREFDDKESLHMVEYMFLLTADGFIVSAEPYSLLKTPSHSQWQQQLLEENLIDDKQNKGGFLLVRNGQLSFTGGKYLEFTMPTLDEFNAATVKHEAIMITSSRMKQS